MISLISLIAISSGKAFPCQNAQWANAVISFAVASGTDGRVAEDQGKVKHLHYDWTLNGR